MSDLALCLQKMTHLVDFVGLSHVDEGAVCPIDQ